MRFRIDSFKNTVFYLPFVPVKQFSWSGMREMHNLLSTNLDEVSVRKLFNFVFNVT